MKTKIKLSIVLLGCMLITGLFSCQKKVKVNEQEVKLTAQIKTLEARSDSLMKIYLATIDQIDSSLNYVRDNQGVLVSGSMSNGEIGTSKKEQILNNITLLNGLLKENKLTIASLEQSLSQYKAGNVELAASLKKVKGEAEDLEKQINVMKLALVEKDFKIDDLNKTNSQKDATISQKEMAIQDLTSKNKEQVTALNKTYFTCATYKKLKDENIVEKEGGVLGLTSAKVLSKNLNTSDFVVLDKSKDTTIQLTGKNPKIITEHPEGTYTLETENSELSVLSIKDPENFWKVSKYLIVEVH